MSNIKKGVPVRKDDSLVGGASGRDGSLIADQLN